MQGIYKITNLINNKTYVGRAKNISKRWSEHRTLPFILGHKEYEKTLYRAIRKYGLENFHFEVLEELDDYTQAGEREKYWAAFYNSYTFLGTGYNESLAGDGGSSPGHCQGEKNGRVKITKDIVIFIRLKYKEGISRKKCYQLISSKIPKTTFDLIWEGRTWKHIMPEVYTEENKKRNEKFGKSQGAIRKHSKEEIIDIRLKKKNGVKKSKVWEEYKNSFSQGCFNDVWYYKTYKEIEV